MKKLIPFKKTLPGIMIAFCIIVWGSSYVAVQIGLESFTPSQLASYRFSVASVVMLPVIFIRKLRLPTPKETLNILLISTIGIFTYHITLNYSSVYYPANSVSFVANSMPVFAAILSALVLREKIPLLGWLGIVMALLGIGLLNYDGLIVLNFEVAVLIIIPISSAIFFVVQKPLLKNLRSYEVMLYSIFTGALALILFDNSFIAQISRSSTVANGAVIYLGVVPTAIAFNLWSYVQTKQDVSYLSRYVYLVPVFTIIFSFVLLNQYPQKNALLGGGVILFGVYLSQRKK